MQNKLLNPTLYACYKIINYADTILTPQKLEQHAWHGRRSGKMAVALVFQNGKRRNVILQRCHLGPKHNEFTQIHETTYVFKHGGRCLGNFEETQIYVIFRNLICLTSDTDAYNRSAIQPLTAEHLDGPLGLRRSVFGVPVLR